LKIALFPGDDPISIEARNNATHLFNIWYSICLLYWYKVKILTQLGRSLRSHLAVKRVLNKERLDKKAFEWLIGEIESKFRRALVNPGESVGCIAAQSLGEPVTQVARIS
jgi:DNA-directed RNA polymerase II subunit RPB1